MQRGQCRLTPWCVRWVQRYVCVNLSNAACFQLQTPVCALEFTITAPCNPEISIYLNNLDWLLFFVINKLPNGWTALVKYKKILPVTNVQLFVIVNPWIQTEKSTNILVYWRTPSKLLKFFKTCIKIVHHYFFAIYM